MTILPLETSPAPPADGARPRVFFAEYCCCGGTFDQSEDDLGSSLAPEGTAMWRAMVEDLSEFCDVVTPIDERLPLHGESVGWTLPVGVKLFPVQPSPNPWRQWIDAAKSCDHAILIVPETGGLLAMGIGVLRGAGIHVLAPGPETLRLSSDKWLTAKFFAQQGIAHPLTFERITDRARAALSIADSFVVKPRDGCGATDVRFYDNLETAIASMQDGELIQTRVRGRAASVLAVASPTQSSLTVLPGVWQTITLRPSHHTATAMQYAGGCGPVDGESQRRIEALASRVIERLPGSLAGFVGIDLILGDDANHDCAIEINPRLTTSYVGMRQMVRENLARRLIAPNQSPIHLDSPCESITWQIAAPTKARSIARSSSR